MWPGPVAPMFWAFCDGQSLDKVRYANIYSIIGDTYTAVPNATTFDLPNFNNRFPVQKSLGSTGGNEEVTLNVANLPAHNHLVNVYSQAGNTNTPVNTLPANTGAFDNEYASGVVSDATMTDVAISDTGSDQPVNILPPYLGINFIINTGV